MAVPRKKMSKSRIGMRRSGHHEQIVTWVEDKKSGELRRPHHILPKSRTLPEQTPISICSTLGLSCFVVA